MTGAAVAGVEKLFEPIRIGGAQMPNRIALAPMTTCFADRDGYVTERQIEFLSERARGGAGLVMTEGAAVDPRGRGWEHHFSIFNDDYLPGLSRLAEAIHRHDSLAWLQLMHNGRRTVSNVTGVQPISSTGRRSPGQAWEIPHRLSTDEVHAVIELFVDAVERGAKAGFDGVELHGGHAYLINQFLSPGKNDRDDEFGGDAASRARFACEIIRRCHQRLGNDYPVGVRLSVVEFEPDGITLEDTKETMAVLEEAGAAYIDGSAGVSTLTKELQWTIGEGEATLSDYARQVRGCLEDIPYMTVGRILHPEVAVRVLEDGVADIVGLGRALISDPEWPRKAAAGQPFMLCIGCNGCQQRSVHRQSGCPVNVRVGHEHEYEEKPTANPLRVLIVESSVGGLEAALTASRRGHEVMLVSRRLPLGGLLGLRARVPGNEEIVETMAEFARRLDEHGVDRPTDGELQDVIDRFRPDVVVDAGPGPEITTALPWPSVGVEDVLGESPSSASSERIAVVGSGYAALEAAIRLAEDGHDVCVLSESQRVGRDTHPQLAYRAQERLEQRGGRVLPGVTGRELATMTFSRPTVSTNGSTVQVGDFDRAVTALGWSALPRLTPSDVGDLQYHHVGDVYTPWDQRFIAERGAEFGLSL